MRNDPVQRASSSHPDGALEQLLYRSVSTGEVSSVIQMSDILAEARPRNASLAVTGVLTAIGGVFVQILEGPPESLNTLLALLRGDRRHRDLVILERRMVRVRAFADWDMISPRLAGLEIAQMSLLLSETGGALDAFIPTFENALSRQDRILEGLDRPAASRDGAAVLPTQRAGAHGDPGA